MRWIAPLLLIAACGTPDRVPEAADLYGDWSAEASDGPRTFHFAASDDGTHPELAGQLDVYVLESPGGQQTGHFSIQQVALSELGGEVADALVVDALGGAGAPGQYANRIRNYTEGTLTITSSVEEGQLTFSRD